MLLILLCLTLFSSHIAKLMTESSATRNIFRGPRRENLQYQQEDITVYHKMLLEEFLKTLSPKTWREPSTWWLSHVAWHLNFALQCKHVGGSNRVDGGGIEIPFAEKAKRACVLHSIQASNGTHPARLYLMVGKLSSELKSPVHEVDHSPLFTAKVRNRWSHTSALHTPWLCLSKYVSKKTSLFILILYFGLLKYENKYIL
jgi:hypothetical protein